MDRAIQQRTSTYARRTLHALLQSHSGEADTYRRLRDCSHQLTDAFAPFGAQAPHPHFPNYAYRSHDTWLTRRSALALAARGWTVEHVITFIERVRDLHAYRVIDGTERSGAQRACVILSDSTMRAEAGPFALFTGAEAYGWLMTDRAAAALYMEQPVSMRTWVAREVAPLLVHMNPDVALLAYTNGVVASSVTAPPDEGVVEQWRRATEAIMAGNRA